MSKFATLNDTPFKPFKHTYTLYTVEGSPDALYVESDTFGDEKAQTYYFDENFKIVDQEGSAIFSDAFEDELIRHIKVALETDSAKAAISELLPLLEFCPKDCILQVLTGWNTRWKFTMNTSELFALYEDMTAKE